MPFSFIDIEERKTREIIFVFIGLTLFYFAGASALILVADFCLTYNGRCLYTSDGFLLRPQVFLYTFLAAVVAAALHWMYSVYSSIPRLLKAMRAVTPDVNDSYHKQLKNIVDEVSVACGGRKMDCVVLPVPALNAFSIADFSGNAAIGVTEGLLTRLNRAQLEAVIAHEAAHIVMQDTLLKTATVSIVSVFTGLNRLCSEILRGSSRSSRSSKGGGAILLVLLLYVTTAVLKFFTYLISMFISRQCEYRADAVAVRLVRDPLALAQALRKISGGWRGGGDIYDSFESLFIVSPNYSHLDESEGVFSNLFSTHPPALKRIGILVDMGHATMNVLDQSIKDVKAARIIQSVAIPVGETKWSIATNKGWEGPFSLSEMGQKPLRYDDLVMRSGDSRSVLLSNDPILLKFLKNNKKTDGINGCPHCALPLTEASYEGVPIEVCGSCHGALVSDERLPRILIRREQGFSPDVVREAKLVVDRASKLFLYQPPKFSHDLLCPKCGEKMCRHFYSMVYPVEVDTCYACSLTWYDERELEIVQYLIENSEAV